jgi:hypothetical protein
MSITADSLAEVFPCQIGRHKLGEARMTGMTQSEYSFPRIVGSVGYRGREESDGLFVVTLCSVVGLALTALTIWLGRGGQLEPLIGLG